MTVADGNAEFLEYIALLGRPVDADSVGLLRADKQSVAGSGRVRSDRARRLLEIHRLLQETVSSRWHHDVLELTLAVVSSVPIPSAMHPLWLFIVAAPGAGKTDCVGLVRPLDCFHFLDSLTENALVSGYLDKRGNKAPQGIDALRDKCLVVKDLSPFFGGRPDVVQKVLGDFCAAYDGELLKGTGTVGTVGGEARFSRIRCLPPVPPQ